MKAKFNKSFKHSIECNERSRVTYSSPMLWCVMLYNCLYRPSQQLLIRCVASHSRYARRGFHNSAILILLSPTRRIIRVNGTKYIMTSICKFSWNILVTLCSFQLAKRVERRQSWWKTNLNSWTVHRVFVWRRHFLLYPSCDGVLLPCIVFKNTAKYV